MEHSIQTSDSFIHSSGAAVGRWQSFEFRRAFQPTPPNQYLDQLSCFSSAAHSFSQPPNIQSFTVLFGDKTPTIEVTVPMKKYGLTMQSTPQTTSRSVQTFCTTHGRDRQTQTDRHTDHDASVARGRI